MVKVLSDTEHTAKSPPGTLEGAARIRPIVAHMPANLCPGTPPGDTTA